MLEINRLLPIMLAVLAGCGDDLKPNVDGSVIRPDACVPDVELETLTTGELVLESPDREKLLPMMPALDRSILWFSVHEIESAPRHGAVLCHLVAADQVAGTPAALRCARESPGTDQAGSMGQIHVRWTVATFKSGVKVQRGLAETTPPETNPQVVTLAPAVDASASFVVLGGVLQGGGGWGNNEFTLATLTDSTLTIKHNTPGARVPFQVVSLLGTKVQRGTAAMTMTETEKSVTLTGVPANSFVLASYNTDNPGSIVAAALMVQAKLDGQTVTFKRAEGGAAVDIAFEVITLPFPTDTFNTDFAAGQAMQTVAVPGLKTASGVAFATMQSILGQSAGMTAYNDANTLDLLGEASASLTTAAGSVTLLRESTTSTASISWVAVEFSEDGCP